MRENADAVRLLLSARLCGRVLALFVALCPTRDHGPVSKGVGVWQGDFERPERLATATTGADRGRSVLD